MPFTNPEFPGQRFKTIEEFEEARKLRKEVEENLRRSAQEDASSVTRVTATIVPATERLLEEKIASIEQKVEGLSSALEQLASGAEQEPPSHNREGIRIGTILQGESKGVKYTLEVLVDGYLCSNGSIYASLSGAALGVSGNRRSGWKFWRDVEGTPIGEVIGRFKAGDDSSDPHAAQPMP